MSEADYHAGLTKRRAILGDDVVDRALASATNLSVDFQRFVTEYCWGGLWLREGMSDDVRSLVTIAVLAAQGRADELRTHLTGPALRNGCTEEQIRETLFHVAVYAGVPAAVSAFKMAGEVEWPSAEGDSD